MDKVRNIALVVILGIFVISHSYAQKNEKEEKLTTLQVVKNMQNVGKVKKGKEIKAVFNIINTGKERLIIKEVTTSCSCTRYELSANNVLPNKTIKLLLVVDTKNKRDGEHNFNALIKTNTYNRFYILKVKVNIYSNK